MHGYTYMYTYCTIIDNTRKVHVYKHLVLQCTCTLIFIFVFLDTCTLNCSQLISLLTTTLLYFHTTACTQCNELNYTCTCTHVYTVYSIHICVYIWMCTYMYVRTLYSIYVLVHVCTLNVHTCTYTCTVPTILAKWCNASCAVTGSASGGSTPSDTPGTTTLALIRILALRDMMRRWVAFNVARRRFGDALRTLCRLFMVISPTSVGSGEFLSPAGREEKRGGMGRGQKREREQEQERRDREREGGVNIHVYNYYTCACTWVVDLHVHVDHMCIYNNMHIIIYVHTCTCSCTCNIHVKGRYLSKHIKKRWYS